MLRGASAERYPADVDIRIDGPFPVTGGGNTELLLIHREPDDAVCDGVRDLAQKRAWDAVELLRERHSE